MATDELELTLEERVDRLEQEFVKRHQQIAEVTHHQVITGITARAKRLCAYKAAVDAARKDVPVESLVGPDIAALVPATPAID